MTEEGPDGRQREIRLTPPPRIEPVGSTSGRRRRPSSPAFGPGSTIARAGRRARPSWFAPLAFGLLALFAALAIYLMPPGKGSVPTETRSASAGGAGPAPTRVEPDRAEASAPRAPDRVATEPRARPRIDASPGEVRAPAGTAGPATEFGRAMADGLAAIEAGDLAAAREALARAAALDPDSPEPAAGLARLEAAASRSALEELRGRAAGLLANEAWREAAAEYRAALEIDPTLTFAREGLERAEARARLSERLAFHLERPDRLTADEVLTEADRLLETARGIADAGPRHAAQVAALDDLVARVRVPVRVALLSDDRTEVTVYQVGRLGTFDRRELELRPGTYTVVGSRAGYRDVRRQLEIEPGETPEPLEIRCEEKI